MKATVEMIGCGGTELFAESASVTVQHINDCPILSTCWRASSFLISPSEPSYTHTHPHTTAGVRISLPSQQTAASSTPSHSENPEHCPADIKGPAVLLYAAFTNRNNPLCKGFCLFSKVYFIVRKTKYSESPHTHYGWKLWSPEFWSSSWCI